jgi:tetraacyldisaccharide-1-P 4'-kinase
VIVLAREDVEIHPYVLQTMTEQFLCPKGIWREENSPKASIKFLTSTTTITNQNLIEEEIKRRLNSEIIATIQSRLLSKNIKI